ncbi:unnamed protein product [marine sediment metagenome]|uniref:Uncharacterized protein n=1 Tax=marine sediment metagenome TaxID=412755 RepID=X1CI60_9ZZZZ
MFCNAAELIEQVAKHRAIACPYKMIFHLDIVRVSVRVRVRVVVVVVVVVITCTGTTSRFSSKQSNAILAQTFSDPEIS